MKFVKEIYIVFLTHLTRALSFNKYINEPTLNSFVCQEAVHSFNIILPNAARCTVECEMTDGCISVFYSSVDLTCVGCRALYDTQIGLIPAGTDTHYFHRDVNSCPDETWTLFNGNCYNFVQLNYTWPGAKDHCALLGSRLADIATTEENEFIKAEGSKIGWDFWLGGYGDGTSWKWDSSDLPWSADIVTQEAYDLSDPAEYYCIQLWRYGWEWDEYYCDGDTQYFICKRSARGID